MHTLCVVILTYNEEKNIARCIEAVRDVADEIFLVDSGSTDATISIAENLGVKVYRRALNGDFAEQRNYALEKTNADYILYIDADETATPELCACISKCVRAGENIVLKIKRCNIAFGKPVNHGVLTPDYVARFFPRGAVHWVGKVHERGIHKLPERIADGCVQHEIYTSWEQYLKKMNLYSEIAAVQMHENGRKLNVFKDFFVRFAWSFFKMYILKKGFLDGILGWALSWNYA